MGLMACEKQNNNDNYYGVVEGFYGRPWGTEGRKSMITFLGDNGLDLYVYGPKDDPYHTDKWAEPYPVQAHLQAVLMGPLQEAFRIREFFLVPLPAGPAVLVPVHVHDDHVQGGKPRSLCLAMTSLSSFSV